MNKSLNNGGCELLSFIVSLLFENSTMTDKQLIKEVVNCFHLSYLCSLKTAARTGRTLYVRCELLSFIVSLLFENSFSCVLTHVRVVVNCFHLSYLCSLKTAGDPPQQAERSCELLSFIVSLLFENSNYQKVTKRIKL